MKPQITFEYYDGSSKKRPPMSDKLWWLIQEAVKRVGASKCHIVHIGTVGNPKTHRPGTSHMTKPKPNAIDAKKVFLKWDDGRAFELDMTTSLDNRKAVAKVWESLGGKTAHKTQKQHGHIHLQTPKAWW